MKTKKKELVNDLLVVLAPQLSGIVPAGQEPPKAFVKAVRLLADQLLRLRAKQEKLAAKTVLTPKKAKQKLTDELTAVLATHFSDEPLEEEANRLLTETAEELAGKLTKLHSKQAQKSKKSLPDASASLEAVGELASAAPPKRAVRRPSAKSLPPAKSMRIG
jgi:hypothetical protein